MSDHPPQRPSSYHVAGDLLLLLGLLAGFGPAGAVPGAAQAGDTVSPLRGYPPSAAAAQLRVEERMAGLLSRDSTARYFRHFTAEPHLAGSERNRELAEYLADRFREYGLEDVRLLRYDVYLPWPEEVRVEMLEPHPYTLSLHERGFLVDEDSRRELQPAYLGMSASGDTVGELVYANGGNPSDYDWLESRGIDLEGKIALVRYSVPYSYRGYKALVAQRRGLAALLIYSDPEGDGYVRGPTFPNGPWGPPDHIQRGSITYDFLVPGDPLTPGWPSTEGARRIPVAEARSVPGIMAVPVSHAEAERLFRALDGPVTPEAWRGGLPLEYRAGPGPTGLRVRVRMDDRVRPIWVTEGRIRGSEEPDRTVVLGNHRDAWVYGAVDPSSGTATQLELARVLGRLKAEGIRPRRTLVLASWDAEEWHLTGSTEWGEELADELRAGAVAYLNVDGSTSGSSFQAGGVPSLNRLVAQVARDVEDPASGGSLLEAWRADRAGEAGAGVIGGRAAGEEGARDPVDFVGNELGSGSDYTVFLNYLGVPIMDLSFDGPYGVYHSKYDNRYWMENFGDPGYRYMTAMADVWGRMALRLANAPVHPFDFRLYAERVEGFVDELAREPGVDRNLDLTPVREAVAAWGDAASRLEETVAGALEEEELGGTAGATDRFRALNDRLLSVERLFLLEEGIPDRPWYRHALYAPRYTYLPVMLPGVSEAAEEGDWERARSQAALLAERLRAVAGALEEAVGLVP